MTLEGTTQPEALVEVDPGPRLEVQDGAAPPAGPRPLPGQEAALRGAVEAVLLVSGSPIEPAVLARALGVREDEALAVLQELAGQYDADVRGFELREAGGGWRLLTRPEHDAVVERFVLDGQTSRLSQAALETLAIVAYRQPVSRARVAAIRGVAVDAVVRTLLTRGMVTEVGTDPETGAVLYGTTPAFLERLGLRTLEDLPDLGPLLPDAPDDDTDLHATLDL